ncbi:MAG TPA: twin-arginine translocation signal domain-containing protein, partial [Thermomicrobiales bacterium]|nr:twin-arginine translocation signal domain-containing protein [Thermomicrobiales bacterium]
MDGKHLQTLIGQVRTGEMNRRGFLRATAALGLSAGAASVLFKNVAAQDATAETSGSGEIIRSMSREEAMA